MPALIAILVKASGNIWVRRVCLAVVVFVALLAVRQHYINLGVGRGETQEKQVVAGANEQSRASDRDQLAVTLEKLNARLDASEKRADADRQLFLSLVGQRQQAAAQVQGASPEQVRGIINEYLGKKPDATDYSVEDGRKIAGCVSQLPLCEKQVSSLSAERDELASQIHDASTRYDALSGYTTELERDYVGLYNAQAPKKRSVKCLYLWKCQQSKIPTPDPKTLRRP